jgi:hypothetical protein
MRVKSVTLAVTDDGKKFAAAVRFVDSIGIRVVFDRITIPTWYPGALIDGGTLHIDSIHHPAVGDLLHEAAHIAVAPVQRRSTDFGRLRVDSDEEAATIAWCWAATVKLRLSPQSCFNARSSAYVDRSSEIVRQASEGQCPGVAQLQTWSMASTLFPDMILWMRGS